MHLLKSHDILWLWLRIRFRDFTADTIHHPGERDWNVEETVDGVLHKELPIERYLFVVEWLWIKLGTAGLNFRHGDCRKGKEGLLLIRKGVEGFEVRRVMERCELHQAASPGVRIPQVRFEGVR